MPSSQSFFLKRQKALALAATVYVVLLLLFHWQLPSIHVWVIAAVFSVAMNFTYLTEALAMRKHVVAECLISVLLISMSLLGLVLSPLLLILAIFGHGCWDLAKHFGRGVPFFKWYTCSCFLVDSLYSLVLALYWFSAAQHFTAAG